MQSDRKSTGRKGEDLAVSCLLNKGYTILHRNWRKEHVEIDIIAKRDSTLVFCEVKSRNSTNDEFPVSLKQEKSIQHGADLFLMEYEWLGDIRFDLITVRNPHDISFEISHMENAFN